MVERNPKRILIYGLIAIALVIGCFYLGVEVGVFEAREYREKAYELESAYSRLTDDLENIEKEFAAAKLTLDIQDKTIGDLRSSLASAAGDQQEMLQSLEFYKRVISNSPTKKGFNASGLRFIKYQEDLEYEFDLVFRQSGDSRRSVNADIKIDIMGWRDQLRETHSIEVLGEFNDYPIQANFRHFFRQTGFIKLPEGFMPEATKVSIRKRGGSYETTLFPWDTTLQLKATDSYKS